MFSIFIFLLSVFFTQTSFSSPKNPDFADKLEKLHQAGIITSQRKDQILDTAIREPHNLSVEYRRLLQQYPLPSSVTAQLLDIFQKKVFSGARVDYNFPAEMPAHLDSEIVPLRVYYDPIENSETEAQNLLEAAELGWQVQINDFGFYEPPVVTPENRYRIYFTDASGASGYCAPVGGYPETEWDDCISYIVIDNTLPPAHVADTVIHELNHSMQVAMDCLEPSAFLENTAVYMQYAVNENSINYIAPYMSSQFQNYPAKSLCEGDTTSSYMYGGYIWPLYLAEIYGEGPQDAVFIRQIWEKAMQESGFTENTIHYLEAIDTQLQATSGANFHEAYHGFRRAQYFVDDNYSAFMSTLPFSEIISPAVPLVDTLTMQGEEHLYSPDEIHHPFPYGANYYLLQNPDNIQRNLKIEMLNINDNPWTLQLIEIDGEKHKLVNSDSTRVLVFDPSSGSDFLLIVSQLAREDFNPANLPFSGSDYTLQMGYEVPLPLITLLTPVQIQQGETKTIKIYGSNFQEELELALSNSPKIEIQEITLVNGVINAVISVDTDSPAGFRNLEVVNSDGGSYTFENALEVTVREKSDNGSGCSSSVIKKQPPFLLFSLILVFLIFFWKKSHSKRNKYV
ncbi:MAG: DUF6055 domain-containing protein [Myxococcota bacterium]